MCYEYIPRRFILRVFIVTIEFVTCINYETYHYETLSILVKFFFSFYFRYPSQDFLSWHSAFTRPGKKVSGHAVHLKVLKYEPKPFKVDPFSLDTLLLVGRPRWKHLVNLRFILSLYLNDLNFKVFLIWRNWVELHGSGDYDDYHNNGVCCLPKNCWKIWDQCVINFSHKKPSILWSLAVNYIRNTP